jgi:hypothetical protein
LPSDDRLNFLPFLCYPFSLGSPIAAHSRVDDVDMGFSPIQTHHKKKSYQVDHETFTEKDIAAKLDKQIQHVSALLGLEPPNVGTLLRHFRCVPLSFFLIIHPINRCIVRILSHGADGMKKS